jgi:hypothetical protein
MDQARCYEQDLKPALRGLCVSQSNRSAGIAARTL